MDSVERHMAPGERVAVTAGAGFVGIGALARRLLMARAQLA